MLLNDIKRSHGMFSRAGKTSAEIYHILFKKDDNSSKNKTKTKTWNMFAPEQNIKKTETSEDNIDIFKYEKKIIFKRN